MKRTKKATDVRTLNKKNILKMNKKKLMDAYDNLIAENGSTPESGGCSYCIYCNECNTCVNCCLCVGLVEKEFHILNTAFTESEYRKIVKKVIKSRLRLKEINLNLLEKIKELFVCN